MLLADWIPELRHVGWIPRWTALNRWGRNRVLRSSYIWLFLVPILAKLLVKVSPDITLALFGTTLTFHLGLPFSWKLFYYAAVAFAAFSFLYAIRCPRIVRDYDRFRDFIDEGRGGRQILQEALHVFWRPSPFSAPEIQREVVRRFLTSIGHHLADDPNLSPAQLREFDIPQGREADAFWLVRGHADTAHPFARALCAVLTTLGFFLIVIVVYENFRYVWWVTF